MYYDICSLTEAEMHRIRLFNFQLALATINKVFKVLVIKPIRFFFSFFFHSLRGLIRLKGKSVRG